jgi:hypothetical protein
MQHQYTNQSLEFTYFNNKVLNYDIGLKAIISKPLIKKGLIIESSSEEESLSSYSPSKKITPLPISDSSSDVNESSSDDESA